MPTPDARLTDGDCHLTETSHWLEPIHASVGRAACPDAMKVPDRFSIPGSALVISGRDWIVIARDFGGIGRHTEELGATRMNSAPHGGIGRHTV